MRLHWVAINASLTSLPLELSFSPLPSRRFQWMVSQSLRGVAPRMRRSIVTRYLRFLTRDGARVAVLSGELAALV